MLSGTNNKETLSSTTAYCWFSCFCKRILVYFRRFFLRLVDLKKMGNFEVLFLKNLENFGKFWKNSKVLGKFGEFWKKKESFDIETWKTKENFGKSWKFYKSWEILQKNLGFFWENRKNLKKRGKKQKKNWRKQNLGIFFKIWKKLANLAKLETSL